MLIPWIFRLVMLLAQEGPDACIEALEAAGGDHRATEYCHCNVRAIEACEARGSDHVGCADVYCE